MGVEGYSMGNMGLNTDLNSVQMVAQVEQIAQKEAQIVIKDVVKSDESAYIKKEKKNSKNDQEYDSSDDETDREAESSDEKDKILEITRSGLTEKDYEQFNPKDLLIRLNPKTQLVELIRKEDKKVLESMPADELVGFMSKLDSSLGILVNRKV